MQETGITPVLQRWLSHRPSQLTAPTRSQGQDHLSGVRFRFSGPTRPEDLRRNLSFPAFPG